MTGQSAGPWRLLWPWLVRLLASLGLSFMSTAAHAVITCSLSAPVAVNFAYVSATSNTRAGNVQQGSVTANCTRTSAADPTTVTLSASNGLYASGQGNNVRQVFGGTNFQIAYDLYQDSACSLNWRDRKNSTISATLSGTALNTPVSATFPYWACKLAAQTLTSYPSGLYSDRVDLVLYAASTAVATSSLNVNIYAPAVCSISNGPSQLTFSYNAFSPTAVFAGTSFRANCTNFLPYTLALSPVSGVVGGLRYTLGLSLSAAGSASNIGPVSLDAVGNATGTATHYINGAMVAGQPGQAGTIVPQPHTLTITY